MLGATLASTLSVLAASRALLPAASFHLVVRDATTSHLSLLHNLAHMPWVQVSAARRRPQPHHPAHPAQPACTSHITLPNG